MSCSQLGQAETFAALSQRSCCDWWTSPGSLQVSHQRGQAHVCTGWKAECMSCLTHTCLLRASVNLTLPLLKCKSIKKCVTENQPLLQTSTSEAHCKPPVNAEWLLQVKEPPAPASRDTESSRGAEHLSLKEHLEQDFVTLI